MDWFFFDTSAIVKRYYEEEGSETVDQIIENEDTQVVITSLSIIETTSAFRRKYNAEEISNRDVNALLSSFFQEALDDFVLVPLEETLLQQAFDLVLEDDLRTLDSLQLSTALSLQAELEDMAFVCADDDLVSVAHRQELNTVNPTKDSEHR